MHKRTRKKMATKILTTLSLVDLNDDCLVHLFEFLSMEDRIILCNLTPRFLSVLEIVLKKENHITFRYVPGARENISIGQLTRLNYCVTLFRSVTFNGCYGFIKDLPRKLLCLHDNITKLEIISIPLDLKKIITLITKNFTNLKTLSLIRCRLTDAKIKLLNKLENIESLDLSYNKNITGQHLDNFPKLTRLTIKECPDISRKLLLTNLKFLYIYSPEHLLFFGDENTLLIKDIQQYENLEELVLDYRGEATQQVLRLPKLKSLTLIDYVYQGDFGSFFSNLAISRNRTLCELKLLNPILMNQCLRVLYTMENLTSVTLSGPYIHDSVISIIPCSFPKLKVLTLIECWYITRSGITSLIEWGAIEQLNIYECRQLKKNLIYNIIETQMKNYELKRFKFCRINLLNNGISTDILKDEHYIRNRKYISITFDTPRDTFSPSTTRTDLLILTKNCLPANYW